MGLVELQRRLIERYIRRASDHEVVVGWRAPKPKARETDVPPRGPLAVQERRVWDSVLAPVYVQLLEGLRRVTEGQRGAAFCRECGQPFLTIDARRTSFCTDTERFRYTQRERRKRLAAAAAAEETRP